MPALVRELDARLGDLGGTGLVVDDSIMSGGTLIDVADKLMDQGATDVYALITHGALGVGAAERIQASPVKKLFITDTIENQPDELPEKIEFVSVATVFGEITLLVAATPGLILIISTADTVHLASAYVV